MRRIVIDMQNTLFADAIAEALRRFDSDLDPILSESPDQTLSLCKTISAHVLIMEVTAYTAWCLEERLKLRDALKEAVPYGHALNDHKRASMEKLGDIYGGGKSFAPPAPEMEGAEEQGYGFDLGMRF